MVLAPILLIACATSVAPVRPGSGGAGSGASASSGLGGGVGGEPSTSTTGGGAPPATTVSSSAATVTSATASSSSGGTTASSSTTSSAASSASSSSGDAGTVMGLSVEYLCDATAGMVQEMKPWFQIINNGTSAVALDSLELRYFYTKDGMPATDQTCDCDYALIGCSALTTSFAAWTGTSADEYVQISFQASAGSLAPGMSTGEIQARIHSTDYQYMLNQANDYSFDATKTAFAAWTHVTLYQNGTLVWGTEP